MKGNRFYSMSLEEIFQRLQTSEDGLSQKEASRRIKKYGYKGRK